MLTYAEIWRYALQIQLCQFVGQVSKVCAYIGTRNIEVAVFYKWTRGGGEIFQFIFYIMWIFCVCMVFDVLEVLASAIQPCRKFQIESVSSFF